MHSSSGESQYHIEVGIWLHEKHLDIPFFGDTMLMSGQSADVGN